MQSNLNDLDQGRLVRRPRYSHSPASKKTADQNLFEPQEESLTEREANSRFAPYDDDEDDVSASISEKGDEESWLNDKNTDWV